MMESLLGFIFFLLSGIFCFWLFFKCVDWFEKSKTVPVYVYIIICD